MRMMAALREKLAFWRPGRPSIPFAVLFKKFKSVLERNNKILELMADMGDKLGGEYVFDRQYIISACEQMSDLVFKLISDSSVLSQRKNVRLFMAFERIQHEIQEELAGRHAVPATSFALPLSALGRDLNEEAGNKLANLGDVRNVLGLPTPDGFVITTKAFADFMQATGLQRYVDERAAAWDGCDEEAFEAMCRDIRARVMAAEVPKQVVSYVRGMIEELAGRHDGQPMYFAVRSSAWGEDGESTFAGQYESVLNVPPSGLFEAWKRVVASVWSSEAWRYRMHRGYQEHEIAMAVGCQLMVEAEVSGGLYTYAPMSGGDESMVVSAAWGLGAPVVDGTAETDTFVLERSAPHAERSREIGRKASALEAAPGGGTEEVPVEESRRDVPSLNQARLKRLAQAAMTIERYYKRPQDMEWSFDKNGFMYILQARPLNIRPRVAEAVPRIEDATRDATVLFSGKGTVVQGGVAAGRVYVVHRNDDLSKFPHGAILVAPFTSPRFSKVMRKAQGIITDVGSPAGHMAAIAREFRVPTVVGVGEATRLLKDGDEITLDATGNVVYQGALRELCRYELTAEDVFEESYEYRLLRRLIKRISPLNLVDPHGEGFAPEACRTYHDITRYIHEKAVEALIDLSENHQRYHDSPPRRLASSIPLGLMVIDIEGGLREQEPGGPGDTGPITEEDIVSAPLKSLLAGLSESDMWATEPVSVDLGSFMSSFTRTFSSSLAAPEKVGRNLAVVSREYMNLNLRLGYHFNIVDAYIGDSVNDNYVYFRFLGGVTDITRRSRRARFIAEILEKFDFRVEVHGDLVVGRTKKLSPCRMARKMKLLGGLIAYTRQLDVRLDSDEELARHVKDFIGRIEDRLGEC